MRTALTVLLIVAIAGAALFTARVVRVRRAGDAIPVYPGAREGARHVRYLPRVIAWDDRSSARVDRILALPAGTTLLGVARHAADTLAARGWYLVTPDRLGGANDPQVIVWQRDPDERLDLAPLWPLPGLTREQRLYGGMFPAAFLDEPKVVGWTWSIGGPRSAPPAPPARSIVQPPPPPPPPPR